MVYKTIVQFFEDIVHKQPDATALIYQEQSLSYRELDEQSSAFAKVLCKHACADIVPICLGRTTSMIVAILGVMKAGKAYLPIEEEYPLERIEYMLNDSGANLIVTDSHNQGRFSINELVIDQLALDDSDFQPIASKLAYIIYTSGTTGRPKGVMVEHESFLNMIEAQIEGFKITQGDRVVQFASFSFDASIYETFLALLSSATYVLVKREALLSDFEAVVKRYGINIAVLNPTFLANQPTLTGFKTIITAGEKAIVKDALKYASLCDYVNAYGPTEASICASFYHVDPNKTYATIPIGKAIKNTQIYILDDSLNQVASGSKGEICIAGAGVVKGYLNQSALTNEKFIIHPKFGRIYRSGDIGRVNDDGEIEYLGRVDEQVKVRGFRVELAEVEHILLEAKTIKEAVVLKKEDSLVAYVVGDSTALNLEQKLPGHMIPAQIFELKQLPLTPNGKIDKKALIALELKSEQVAPQNEQEATLLSLFKEVLNQEHIGTTTHFFQAGGHSLLAMKLIAKAKAKGLFFDIQTLYQQATIQALSEHLSTFTKQMHKVPKQEYYPLSSAQKRLWTLHKLEDNLLAYNLPTLVHLKEPLDTTRLEKALNKLFVRHRILRANFIEKEGKAVQVIAPKEAKIEPIHDLTSALARPFNLEKDPLFVLYKLDEKRLFINVHHIIIDGWSMDTLLQELFHLYQGDQLQEVAFDYLDYIDYEANVETKAHQAFWQESLKDYKKLDFPKEFRTKKESFNGAKAHFAFSPKAYVNIMQMEGSLFSALFSLTALVCAKYANQEDILLGSAFANRQEAHTLDMVGMFVNTLPLRLEFNANESFAQHLERAQVMLSGAHAHQSYPFEKIVSDMHVERSDKNPFFDVVIILQEMQEHGIFKEYELLDNHSAKFDLTFEYKHYGKRLDIVFEYNNDFYSQALIERLFKNLEQTMESIRPDSIIGAFNILSSSELKELARFNTTFSDYPQNTNVVEVFEQIVARFPNRVAISYEECELSYQELNARANALAHYLHPRINQGDVVTLYLERSELIAVAIFGIIKAGGVYTPILPDFPQERTKYILEHTQTNYLLSDKDVVFEGVETINLRTINLAPQSKNPHFPTTNVLYLLYTSGTTGVPKGCQVSHENLLHLVKNKGCAKDFVTVDENDTMMLSHSYTFDVSVWEFYATFLNGAKFVMPTDDAIKDPYALLKLIKKHRITLLPKTPLSFYQLMYAELEQKTHTLHHHLRAVMLGGEKVNFIALKPWKELYPDMHIFNIYGATEATIYSSFYDVPYEMMNSSASIIGSSVPDHPIYILDNNLEESPIGAYGEIHFGGGSVGVGYFRNEELTRQRFIEHPKFGRIYKSGDRARWLDIGKIEYLERIDHQVKIRGFRVELGEIETRTLEIEGVEQIYLLVENNQTLILYYRGEADMNTILAHLKERLPHYMIPSLFIKVDKFVMNASGKTDKNYLPKPSEIERDIIEERNVEESAILEVFSAVLNNTNISIEDNFFYIGGDSIKAIEITAKLRQKGFVLEMKDIFYHPSIKELAKIVRINQESVQEKITGAFALLPIQHYFFEHFSVHGHFNQYMLLRSKCALDFNRLESAIQEVINHHDILRSKFIEHQQIIEEECFFTLKRAKSVEHPTFDLSQAPLIEATLLENNYLFVSIHHLIVDVVSFKIIIEDIQKAYQGEKLSQKSASYKEYSHKLYDYAKSLDTSAWLEYQPYSIFEQPMEALNKNRVRVRCDIALKNHAHTQALILLSFAKVLFKRTQKDRFSLLLEGHGRDRFSNLHNSIGWFTTMAFTNILYHPNAHLLAQLHTIEQALHIDEAFTYGIAKYIHKQPLTAQAEVAFNYLGVLANEPHSMFEIEEFNLSSSPENPRVAPIEIEALIRENLEVYLSFDKSFDFEGFDEAFTQEFNTMQAMLESDDIFAQTYGQKGLFLIDKLNEEQRAYNETIAFDFKGNLDKEALKEALIGLTRRHESLRTAFIELDGIAMQKVLSDVEVEIDSGYLDDDLSAIIADFDAQKFDISAPPLFRCKILRSEIGHYILLLSFHHLIIDGWSFGIFLNELSALYNASVTNQEPMLKAPKAQYRDFVHHSKNLLKHAHEDREFWQNKLLNTTAKSYIPYDKEGQNRFNGGLIPIEFDKQMTQKLEKMGKDEGVGLFAVLVLLVDTLFYLYSNEEEIVLGTPIALRENEMFHDQIGLYLNSVVLKSTLSPDQSFQTLLQAIHNDILESKKHQNYPYEKIVEDIQSSGNLFNTMIILQNIKQPKVEFEGLEFEVLEPINNGSKFDMKLEFEQREEKLLLLFEYSQDLYDEVSMQRFGANLQTLVAHLGLEQSINDIAPHIEVAEFIELNQDLDEDF